MIYLDELLEGQSFTDSVLEVAKEFREAHGLQRIGQIGLVVPEVEGAAHQLEQSRSIGRFFVASGKPELWLERGKQRDYKGQLGFAYHEGLELELLEAGAGSNFYRDYVDPSGRIVVHHLGFFVKNVDESANQLAAEGHALWVRGRLRSLFVRSDFAYMDTVSAAGVIVEFISWRILGVRFKPPPFLYHTVGQIQKWLGIRSLSI